MVRSSYTSIIFPYDQVTISITIIYLKEDRYSDKIERRILESLNIIKELWFLLIPISQILNTYYYWF